MSLTPEQKEEIRDHALYRAKVSETARYCLQLLDTAEAQAAEIKELKFANGMNEQVKGMAISDVVAAHDQIEQLRAEVERLQKERWEFEKGMADTHSDLSKAIRILQWYGDEMNYKQGRREGDVFFSRIEDDEGQKAREILAWINP